MYRHAIIIHMSYIDNKRLAFHTVFEDSSIVKDINNNLAQKFQHLRFGFHVIQTQNTSIQSVAEKDPFFEEIQYYTDYNKFLDAVESDIKTQYVDVAKVILSKNSFTPLCLQKVTFSACIQYLKHSNKSLLEESFEAWQHGPVIPDLYQDLKSYRNTNITTLDDYQKKVLHARFLQISEGNEIKDIISNVSDKNSKLTTTAIYNEGHIIR